MQTPKKIFLADDDSDDIILFSEALRDVLPDCSITTATNGEKLLSELLPDGRADFVFLDINMPMMGGLDALEIIRKTEQLKMVPVVMYSTSRNPADLEEALKKGANYYLPKPNCFTTLKDKLRLLFSCDDMFSHTGAFEL